MSIITSNRPKTTLNVLDKRIPRNPKYENVQPTIDTGESLSKYLKRTEELRASSKQQAGEIFKRMKVSTLVQLIIQVTEINSLESPGNAKFDPSASRMTMIDSDRPQTQDSQMSVASSRATLQSVIRGVGEMDMHNNHTSRSQYSMNTPKNQSREEMDLEFEERPYLIVDLRDKDEYKMNHIVSAHHYPAAMLSRCTNNESKELLIYKNQKGKIIVVYDEDERMAPRAVTIMVERGYNNVFLLSGGLKYAARKFPRGLITGTCPLAWTLASTPKTPSSKKVRRTQSMDDNSGGPIIGQSAANANRPPQGPMINFDTREQYTSDDIEHLNAQLDMNLLPTDSGSRLSRAQTQSSKQSSRSSIASERSNWSNISEKPWKP